MANRTVPQRVYHVLLSLSWLACHPLALQTQASTPPGALISIAGRAKCGTSHLHLLLSSHQNVFSLKKEWCPAAGSMDNATFAQYLKFTASRAQVMANSSSRMEYEEMREACVKNFGPASAGNCSFFYRDAAGGPASTTKVLETCMQEGYATVIQRWAPVANARVLFAQRDPADLFWASYNFWVTEMDAKQTVHGTYGEWTNKLNYRSPEHFHELVLSEGRLAGGVDDWPKWLQLEYMRDLRKTFGRDQVLFLRSEDLRLRDTVQKICDFVGLDIDGINPEIIDSKTNSGASFDVRGVGESSDGDEQQQGLYEVSGFKPMLCESRKLIYDQARDVCSAYDKEFGLHYPGCLDPKSVCP